MSETEPWQVWATDTFDRESEPSLAERGVGERDAFRALWRRVLSEGLVDSGAPSFTWFQLHFDSGLRVSVPMDAVSNPELAQLRAWRDEVGVVDALARVLQGREPKVAMAVLLDVVRSCTSASELCAQLRDA